MTVLSETASQTAGPYLHIGMSPRAAGIDSRRREPGNRLAHDRTQGEQIRIEGVVYDGVGEPVRDAIVEIWQAHGQGRYAHPEDEQDKPLDPEFSGFGRAVADFETGLWSFETVKPGSVTGRHGRPMAPHICAVLFARGINVGLHTRIYFADEEQANATDPVLALIESTRRETLLAEPLEPGVYRFDIHLQGDQETVFLDV